MNVAIQKIQSTPVYQNLGHRNVGQNNKTRDVYWPYLIQKESKEMKKPLEGKDAEEERETNNVKEKNEERCRTEFIKVLKANLTGMPEGFEDWSFEQLKEWMINTGYKINKLPVSLGYLIPGLARPGDCGRALAEKPEWLDLDLFRRGQKYGRDNFFSITCANVFALCMVFTDKAVLKPLVITGRSATPYTAFKRYLGTMKSERCWLTHDPWEYGSKAYKDLAVVRGYHQSIINRLRNTSREKIDADSVISDPWSSIRDVFVEDANAACPVNPNIYDVNQNMTYRPPGITQTEMSITQCAIVTFTITYPEAFGIHNADEENLEAYCYFWRCIGFLLGIEDDYNFCRGSLKEIKERAHDVLEMVVIPNFRTANAQWEHMSRCLVHGINYFAPFPSYETTVLFMADILKIPMPRLYAALSYMERLKLASLKFFFKYIMRIPGMCQIINAILNRRLDGALAFSRKKHALLEEKSAKTLLDFSLG